MSKTRRFGIVLLGLVVTAVLWISLRPEPAVPVVGTLSTQDVSDIKNLVRRDLRHRIFPRFSWHNLKNLPSATRNYFRTKIKLIYTDSSGRALIYLRIAEPQKTPPALAAGKDTPEWSIYLNEHLTVIKGTNGWETITVTPLYDFF